MKHVTVIGDPPNDRLGDTTQAKLKITGHGLYSIGSGLVPKDRGPHTLLKPTYEIKAIREKYADPCGAILFVDSGGYPIIRGNVHPRDVDLVIDCYHLYLSRERRTYHYICSLDIPLFLKYPLYNTQAKLFELNHRSLSKSLEVLARHPEIQDKFYFVYQFARPGQYEVWRRLYNDLLADESVVFHRAIGGMVGLRGKTASIKSSPFTAMAYTCLLDYLWAKKRPKDFRLHFLGISIQYDRFQIALLEKLFERYLEREGIVGEPVTTYDSISYCTSANRKVQDLKIFSFENGRLDWYPHIPAVPERILKGVYSEPEALERIVWEVERLRVGRYLADSGSFEALNIYSQVSIDKFFSHIVKAEHLVDIITSSRSKNVVLGKVGEIVTRLKVQYPKLFTSYLVKAIERNLDALYDCHSWFSHRSSNKAKSYASLDALMANVIAGMGLEGLQ